MNILYSYPEGLMNFKYVEIDDEAMQALREKNLYEPLGYKKVELRKWALDPKRQIALLYTGWVSSSIARTDDRTSYWYFLLKAKGNETDIEFSREGSFINSEKYPVQPSEIRLPVGFAARCGLSDEELKLAVCEAINVVETGQRAEYEEKRRLEALERRQKTPGQIMEGEFSEKLRQCIACVNEIDNMEHLFRTICLKHFNEYNVGVQSYDSFYIHDDEDSFFIFDVILWMYLHFNKAAAVERFVEDYPLIANEEYMYKSNYERYFCIGGAIRFLKDSYLAERIKANDIIIDKGIIRFSKMHAEEIVQRLQNVL